MTEKIRTIIEEPEYIKHKAKIRNYNVLKAIDNAIHDFEYDPKDPKEYGNIKHGNQGELIYDLPDGYRLGFRVGSDTVELVYLIDVGEHDKFYNRFDARKKNN